MPSFGSRIKELRTANGWTVRELAEQIGKTAGYISQIEGRGEIPSPELICRFAAVFAVKPEMLLDLAKHDQLDKAESDISERHEAALTLYRKERK